MTNNFFLDFLKNSINQKQDTNLLLNIIKEVSGSEVCCVYLLVEDSTYVNILDKEDIIENSVLYDITYDSSFKPDNPLEYDIILPIQNNDDMLGCLYLAKNNQRYIEEIVLNINIGIVLLQNILEKEKIMYQNKNLNLGKELFLANMSHEIRTPANGVIGYSQLLMQTQLNSTQKSYIQAQNQCSIQLMQIINDILDFSKLSAGKMEINNECFSLQEIIETIRNTMNQKIKEKNQKLTFNVSNDLNQFIISDKQKIIQVIINLVNNAHKFTDINGNISVSFSKNKKFLVIAVKDNGIGIEKSKQKKLFSIYEQLEKNVSKSGTGLGLAICDKLVKLLSGDITVVSDLGRGSEFIVNIDYKPYDDYENKLKKNLQILKGKTVLVVDDNSDNRIVLTEFLFEWNMQPIVCASALEALRLVMGNRYDFSLGLIDIVMPGISGVELARQIKEEKPCFPLIALSSLDTFVNTKEFEEKLDKPINKIQLLDTIYRTILKEHTPKSYIGKSDFVMISKSSSFTQFKRDSKILIAEDIPYNRTLLQNMLESLRYNNITTAGDGSEAYSILKQSYKSNTPFEILLLDLRMPILDGYELIKKIKEKNWKLPEIVVVTASTMDSDIISCKDLGVNYFITKPIDIQNLNDVMLHVTSKLQSLSINLNT